MGRKNWIYSMHLLLFALEVIFLVLTFMMYKNPIFLLIPVNPHSFYTISYFVLNLIQALIAVIAIMSLYHNKLTVIHFLHYALALFVIFDILMIFQYTKIMTNTHLVFSQHISKLVNSQKIKTCTAWESYSKELKTCPPELVFSFCSSNFNISQTICSEYYLDEHYNKLRRWLHSHTDKIAICAFFLIVPLKILMCSLLRNDIEELKEERLSQKYFEEMLLFEIARHGDGYLESFRSKSNLVLNVGKSKPKNVVRHLKSCSSFEEEDKEDEEEGSLPEKAESSQVPLEIQNWRKLKSCSSIHSI